MKIEYKVHGVSNGSANVKAEVNGETINAAAPSLDVELTPADGGTNGTITLRIIGSQAEEAKELFKPDAAITVDFAGKENYAAKEPAKAAKEPAKA
jgi:hypothetical protein